MHRTNTNRREIILMLVLLSVVIAALGIYLAINLQGGADFEVVVDVKGKIVATFPLSEDTTYTIEGVGGYNLLVIKDGRAYVEAADCPGGDCVKYGAIDPDMPLNLRMISCLPHEVTVYLKGDGNE